jgi:outer membrane protein W
MIVIQRIYRCLFLLFLIAGSIRMFAQAPRHEIGAWLVDSEMNETTLLDDDDDDLTIDFEESAGFGVSYNHFWTGVVSTEVMLSKFSARMTIAQDDIGGGTITSEVGELDVQLLTAIAQFHFNRNGRFSPYIGGGAAQISGDFDPADELGEDSIDLESELTWTAAAGANLRLTDHLAIGGEIKYVPWSAVEEDGAGEDAIDIDPVTFSAGLKLRF